MNLSNSSTTSHLAELVASSPAHFSSFTRYPTAGTLTVPEPPLSLLTHYHGDPSAIIRRAGLVSGQRSTSVNSEMRTRRRLPTRHRNAAGRL